MATNKFVFEDAVEYRDKIMKQQEKYISSLYKEWADDIGKQAAALEKKNTFSAMMESRQLHALQAQLEVSAKEVGNKVYSTVQNNAFLVAGSVIKANNKFMQQLGFPVGASTTAVQHRVVSSIINGTIYKQPWSLSKSIWGDNQKTLQDIRTLVARGVAENKPIYKIAKDLERYVDPSKAKQWNPKIRMFNKSTGQFEYKRIYKRSVDYNAQRLGRTMVQHSYQQATIDAARMNPFIMEFLWEAAGSRPCPICEDLNGMRFKKEDIPLDHPNGQCIIIPEVADDLEQRLADWLSNPDGTFPDIDDFARTVGYIPDVKKQVANSVAPFNTYQKQFLEPYGYSPTKMPKDYQEFYDNVYQPNILFGNNKEFQAWSKAIDTEYPGLSLGKANKQFFDKYLKQVEIKKPQAVQKAEKAAAKQVTKNIDDVKGLPWYKAKNEVGPNWYQAQKYMEGKGMSPSAYWKKYASGEIKDSKLDDLLGLGKKELSEGEKFAVKYGQSNGKTFNYWYTKLDDAAKQEAKVLKEQSGLSWQKWYEKYIKKGGGSKAERSVAEQIPKPTNNWKTYIDKMQKQTVDDMLASEKISLSKITQTELNGIQRYTGSAYEYMNDYLRMIGRGVSHEDAMRMSGMDERMYKQMLQAQKGLKKAALTQDTYLRRGTDLGDLAGFMPGDFWENKKALRDMSIKELQQKFEGTLGTYHGFTSTSSLYDRGFEGSVEIIFQAPKGTQASSIMSISNFGTGEGETLLNSGTKVLIEKIEKSDGHKDSTIRIFMRILQ